MDVLFDTHAHMDFPAFDEDREEVFERARRAGVEYMVTVGSGAGLEAADRALMLANSRENVWATAGVHPHDAKLMGDDHLGKLRELAAEDKVVAIGEIGLDYAKQYSPREAQLTRFREQLALSREVNLPVVIHDRDAHEDLMKILKEDGIPKAGGIMHCYSGSAGLAEELMVMGFYISFPGVLTFKNADELRKVAVAAVEDRMLVETDCPFLTPDPHRGKRNEPAYVRHTAEALARARDADIARIARITTRNAFRAFGLGAP